MEDVLSRAWAQKKREEDITSRAKTQQKQDPKGIRSDRTKRDEIPSPRPARDWESKPWQISEPAYQEGRRDGIVHVARHLSPLRHKAEADKMFWGRWANLGTEIRTVDFC